MPPRLPLEQICFDGQYREADEEVMAEWMRQMIAGYKASFPTSSLQAQLGVYQSKIGQAEADLRQMVFGEDDLVNRVSKTNHRATEDRDLLSI